MSAGDPAAVVLDVRLGGMPLGLFSIPRADLAERTPFVFISNERRRLDVERLPHPHRDRIRLVGRGREIRAVFLPEYTATGYGVPVLLLSDERSFAVTDPGPGGRDLKRSRAAAAAAAWDWAEAEAPGVLPLASEARDVLGALRAGLPEGLVLPGNYTLRQSPLDLLGFLLGPVRLMDVRGLSGDLLPSASAAEILDSRPESRDRPLRAPPPASWRGSVTGGRGEKLGDVSVERDESSGESRVVVAWGSGALSEVLRMRLDDEGIVRLTLERTEKRKTAVLAAVETVPAGSGSLWCAPYLVENGEGRRTPTLIPPEPVAETQRARNLFLDALTAALRRGGLSGIEADRLVWRWYRLLDSVPLRDLVPELSPLADVLSYFAAPPFGEGDESAWTGAVEVGASPPR
ncbi:MAG: hypothetical protein ACHQPI_05030 [Thermoanaerobaculia bacterium]